MQHGLYNVVYTGTPGYCITWAVVALGCEKQRHSQHMAFDEGPTLRSTA